MKICAYTFRTYPQIKELEQIFGKVFVFGRLKEDLELFKAIIEKNEPDLILGIANINGSSQIEASSLNRFNRLGKVSKSGPESIELVVPKINLKVSNRPGTSFCNWTAYKLTELFPGKVAFIHLNSKDLLKLLELEKIAII